MAFLTNGPRMNPHDAPTSFIVCMVKHRAYMPSLTVLLISEKDTKVSSTASTSSTILMRCRLLFTLSIRSCG